VIAEDSTLVAELRKFGYKSWFWKVADRIEELGSGCVCDFLNCHGMEGQRCPVHEMNQTPCNHYPDPADIVPEDGCAACKAEPYE